MVIEFEFTLEAQKNLPLLNGFLAPTRGIEISMNTSQHQST